MYVQRGNRDWLRELIDTQRTAKGFASTAKAPTWSRQSSLPPTPTDDEGRRGRARVRAAVIAENGIRKEPSSGASSGSKLESRAELVSRPQVLAHNVVVVPRALDAVGGHVPHIEGVCIDGVRASRMH